jgi:hypothetical protein
LLAMAPNVLAKVNLLPRGNEMTGNIYDFGYRAPRFPADFRLFLQTDNLGSALVDARCTDLSEGGLAAESKASLEVGAVVTLILTLPGTSISRRIAARVINCRVNSYGFAFIFSSHQEQNYMHEYVESRR